MSTGLASAQATGWNGTTSNDWTVGANWSLGTVPTAANTVNLTGVGGLTVTGGGTLSLLADNTYAGETTIEGGNALVLSGAGTIASCSRVIANGTFDIAAVTPASAAIRSLTGGGSVVLGDKTLEITAANDTFAGIIAGTGGLTISDGVQTLTGANTYTGATNVQAGTLIINGDQSAATDLTSVFAGARLGGTGITGGDLTGVAGAVIAPGNSIGTLTVNGDYISNGATLEIEAELGGDSSSAHRASRAATP